MEFAFGIVFSVIAAAAFGAGVYIAVCDYTGNGITPKGKVSHFAFVEFALAAISTFVAISLFIVA